jgi:homoserine kinase
MESALGAGALAAWLSGSGPTAAALVEPAQASKVASALPPGGRAEVLRIAERGVTVTETPESG